MKEEHQMTTTPSPTETKGAATSTSGALARASEEDQFLRIDLTATLCFTSAQSARVKITGKEDR